MKTTWDIYNNKNVLTSKIFEIIHFGKYVGKKTQLLRMRIGAAPMVTGMNISLKIGNIGPLYQEYKEN